MAIDTTRVGQLAADLMDQIAERYDGDDVNVKTVAIVVEIDTDESTAVEFRCSDGRAWVQMGFFEAAKRACIVSSATPADEDDE